MGKGRPKVKDEDKKEVISLRLTKEEKEKYERYANERNLNLSEYIREILSKWGVYH